MIPVPSAARVYVAAGATDMRKGFDGLSALVQETLTRRAAKPTRTRSEAA